MKISKTRNVTTPTRGTKRSSGLDFYIPNFIDDSDFLNHLLKLNNFKLGYDEIESSIHTGIIEIEPQQHILIPSGIKINLSTVKGFNPSDHSGIAFVAHNKSSIGIKQLDVAATVIDEDYQGEIHLSVTNTGLYPVEIAAGMKLVQFLLIPIFLDEIEEVVESELFNQLSERNAGGFGSTGT